MKRTSDSGGWTDFAISPAPPPPGEEEHQEPEEEFEQGAIDRDQVVNTADRDIRIAVLADDNVIGAITCRLDPDLSRPFDATRPEERDCTDAAQALIDCLGFAGRKIKKAKVKEIILGLSLPDDGCCR